MCNHPLRSIWTVAFKGSTRVVGNGLIDGGVCYRDTDEPGDSPKVIKHKIFKQGVRALDFSADGKLGVVGGTEHKVAIFNADTGEVLYVSDNHTAPVACVKFGNKLNLVASADRDGGLCLHNLAERASTVVLPPDGYTGESLCFSPTDHMLVYCNIAPMRKAYARLFDTSSLQLKHALAGFDDYVLTAALSPSGRAIAVGSMEGFKIWDFIDGKSVFEAEKSKTVTSLCYSASGHVLISCHDEIGLTAWDGDDYKLVGVVGVFNNHPISLAVAQNDSLFAAGCRDGSVGIFTTVPAKKSA